MRLPFLPQFLVLVVLPLAKIFLQSITQTARRLLSFVLIIILQFLSLLHYHKEVTVHQHAQEIPPMDGRGHVREVTEEATLSVLPQQNYFLAC